LHNKKLWQISKLANRLSLNKEFNRTPFLQKKVLLQSLMLSLFLNLWLKKQLQPRLSHPLHKLALVLSILLINLLRMSQICQYKIRFNKLNNSKKH
jgi:hypothetical protein